MEDRSERVAAPLPSSAPAHVESAPRRDAGRSIRAVHTPQAWAGAQGAAVPAGDGRAVRRAALLELQRAVGNQAAAGLVPHRRRRGVTAQRRLTVQRRLWRYDGEAWKDKKAVVEEDGPTHDVLAAGPEGEHEAGDVYDDASGQVFNGRNADVKGEPNRFIGYQRLTETQEAVMRSGLAIGKAKVARAIRVVSAAVDTLRSGPAIDPGLATVMRTAFNMPTDLPRTERLRITTIFLAGLARVAEGLNAEGTKLVGGTRMLAYGVAQPANCTGWVPRGLTETGGQSTPVSGIGDLRAVSGAVHINQNQLTGDHNAGFVGDTIVHEAMHKYLGAWDYSYVGVPGSVGRGLRNKAADLQEADDTLEDDEAVAQAMDESGRRAHAMLVKAVVEKGIRSVYPVEARGRPMSVDDSDAVITARELWSKVRTWGVPQQPVPPLSEIRFRANWIASYAETPRGITSELRTYLSDPATFLAEHGNNLNVKGHDVLFALPTEFLLKNADSWTELAIMVGA